MEVDVQSRAAVLFPADFRLKLLYDLHIYGYRTIISDFNI